jgi:murein DD-endopeptidase MepM/ murein hydrolase activator NlpD
MRIQLIIGILTFVSTFSTVVASPVWEGGGEKKGGSDSAATTGDAANASEGVVIRRLNISAADINPDFGKVARWDTSDINMYHVDMVNFQDTLIYSFEGEGSMNYTVPRQGRVTSGFGYRRLFGRKFHKGLDIDLETGDTIVAALDGKIRIARYGNGYGNFVVISHQGGLETVYGHMSQLEVKEGDVVKSGQPIGLGGSTGQSTGSHLHFEIRVFGEQVDPSWVLDQNTLKPIAPVIKIEKSWFYYLGENPESHEAPVHVVTVGETLENIAAMYETDVNTLLLLNGLDPATTEIVEGTRLKLE